MDRLRELLGTDAGGVALFVDGPNVLRDEFDVDEERFRWIGPNDNRTTDTCEAIAAEVGDDGVPLPELKETVKRVAEEHGHNPREFTPHIQCRHTFVRVV